MAYRIWYPGDYEAYHTLRVHSRRMEFGIDYPSHWNMPQPYAKVEFHHEYDAPHDFPATVYAPGSAYIVMEGVGTFFCNREVILPAGHHRILIHVLAPDTLPSVFCESEFLCTDGTWTVTHGAAEPKKAGYSPAYTKANDDVTVFPFRYTRMTPVSVEEADGGILYDFGRESFGKVTLTKLDAAGVTGIFYGESREEALSAKEDCIVWYELTGKKRVELQANAFRFIHLRAANAKDIVLTAKFESLGQKRGGAFECSDARVKKIWDACAHTFELCSRECYLDAVKRDRWAWGGDARQSFMINPYIHYDKDICRRTIRMLLEKAPTQHVNGIVDYSTIMIIAVKEYYDTFGDADFITEIFPRVKALYDFETARLDGETGFVVQRGGDWIFIDWSEMDKSGPLCAEQILLWQAENALAALCTLIGEDGKAHEKKAAKLKKNIMKYFFDGEKQAFIDTYTSGKRNVTRHAAIFAILFDFVPKKTQDTLYESVLRNDRITAITTPYFKLYELAALCKTGHLDAAQRMIGSYWGKMLDMGATSMWEQFEPGVPAPQCYEMYGHKYGKSLCHAWSCGPIYFLGRYCLGVYPTSPAYKTYTVAPNPGLYTSFDGTVPVEGGRIRVKYKDGHISVSSPIDGGTLVWKGKQYTIEKNRTLKV